MARERYGNGYKGRGARAAVGNPVAEVTWARRRRPVVRKGAWPTIGPSESGGRNDLQEGS